MEDIRACVMSGRHGIASGMKVKERQWKGSGRSRNGSAGSGKGSDDASASHVSPGTHRHVVGDLEALVNVGEVDVRD